MHYFFYFDKMRPAGYDSVVGGPDGYSAFTAGRNVGTLPRFGGER